MSRISKPTIILILFVILNLVIGLFIAGDYGRSTDEAPEFRRAKLAVDIYLGERILDLDQPYIEMGEMALKGTAATGLIHMVERVIFPHTDHRGKQIAHFSYFVFFQLAVIGIYLLGNHFYNQSVSLGVAVLFGTQPLLFGHGFINPKDIPLMAIFLLTVATGFSMVDIWLDRQKAKVVAPINHIQKSFWFGTALILIVVILWSRSMVIDLALEWVEQAYTSGESSLSGRIFSSFTTSGSLIGYLTLTETYLSQCYRWATFLSVFLLGLIFNFARRQNLFGGMLSWQVFLAAAIWGLAISIRVIAVATGGIVGLYALLKMRQRAVIPLAIYSLVASVFAYLSWPFFWVFGLRGYFDALTILSDFPWLGTVRFEGLEYDPQELPARYLPKLMGLQFTEPLVILVLVGLVVGLYLLYRKKVDPLKSVLLYGWFFLPMLYVILMKPVVYTNFRHFLFSIPPIFVFAGFALQPVMDRLKKPVWNLVLIAAILLPGLLSIVQYHPYEYIYYNSFTGGINGAYKNYETDYWGLAWKDAMDYVNRNAPSGSKIIIWKNNLNGAYYADEEKEFVFSADVELTEEEMQTYDYLITPFGRTGLFSFLEGSEVVYVAGLGEAKFVAVTKMPD